MKNIIVKIEDEEGNLIAKRDFVSYQVARARFMSRHRPTEFESEVAVVARFSGRCARLIEEQTSFALHPDDEAFYKSIFDCPEWGGDDCYDFDQDELHHPCIPPDSEL